MAAEMRRMMLCSCFGFAVVVLRTFAGAAQAAPAHPDNAALLYYQACFICPDIPGHVYDAARRGDPNEQVSEYLKLPPCEETLALAQAATEMAQCQWGLMQSWGLPLSSSAMSSLKRVGYLLEIHARALAADGQYRAAFEGCITVRRFAAHIGDETLAMSGLAHGVDGRALAAVRDILGSMPTDADMLTWLKEQLVSVPGAPWRPETAVASFRDMQAQWWVARRDDLKNWRRDFLEAIEDETVRKEMQSLDESGLFVSAYNTAGLFMDQAVSIIECQATYAEKYPHLRGLIDRIGQKAKHGDPIALLMDFVESVDSYYRIHVNFSADFNALMNAIEIYAIKARTGQLPEELPAGLPADPYSGQSFEYEVTEGGFILRCRGRAVGYREIRQFEFKARGGTE